MAVLFFLSNNCGGTKKGKYTVNVDTDTEMSPYGAQISGKGILYN